MPDNDEAIEKPSFFSNPFHPENLKRLTISSIAILLGGILIWIMLTILLEGKPDDVPYVYQNLPSFMFTSYEKNYGTFYCRVKQVNLSYFNDDVEDEIKEKIPIIKDTIRKVISEQNYYMINTLEKRRINLAPVVRERLNLLFTTPGGIVDVTFPNIRLLPNKGSLSASNSYFEVGNYVIQMGDKRYKIELYFVYDATAPLFTSLLMNIKFELQQKIAQLVKRFKPVNINDLRRSKKEMLENINQTLKLFFRQMEMKIKVKNPFYEEKGETILKEVFFSLFKQLDKTGENN